MVNRDDSPLLWVESNLFHFTQTSDELPLLTNLTRVKQSPQKSSKTLVITAPLRCIVVWHLHAYKTCVLVIRTGHILAELQ